MGAWPTLIATFITSLDGYVADSDGNFDWSTPSEEVHTFVNDLERPVGTYLYGRRMYEVMVAWETMHHGDDDQPAVMRDYTAIWRAADKIVYSARWRRSSSRRTRIEREFDPDAVRALKASATATLCDRRPAPGRPGLRGRAGRRVHLFVSPVVVGGGTVPARRPAPRPRAAGRDAASATAWSTWATGAAVTPGREILPPPPAPS